MKWQKYIRLWEYIKSLGDLHLLMLRLRGVLAFIWFPLAQNAQNDPVPMQTKQCMLPPAEPINNGPTRYERPFPVVGFSFSSRRRLEGD